MNVVVGERRRPMLAEPVVERLPGLAKPVHGSGGFRLTARLQRGAGGTEIRRGLLDRGVEVGELVAAHHRERQCEHEHGSEGEPASDGMDQQHGCSGGFPEAIYAGKPC
jgi:hypothetical protein